jgi:Predicted membrane protein
MSKKIYTGEKHYRSVMKAVSWRSVGTIDTMVISFIITGNVKFAVSIGGVEVFTKMFLYFLHERLWNKISFGKIEQEPIDYEI